jgi:hypothetical protein
LLGVCIERVLKYRLNEKANPAASFFDCGAAHLVSSCRVNGDPCISHLPCSAHWHFYHLLLENRVELFVRSLVWFAVKRHEESDQCELLFGGEV